MYAGGGFGGDRRGLPRGFRRARYLIGWYMNTTSRHNGHATTNADAPLNAANATRQRCV